jgi:nitrogen fixation protein NifB
MRMKIAVASNDGLSISKHFGRTNRFTVFDIRDDEILAEESREGILSAHVEGHCEAEHAPHDLSHHHGDVIAVLEDCQVVLCRGMGWRAATELVRRGINPLVIVGELSPRVAVEHYLAGTLKPASGFCRRQKEPAAAADNIEPACQRF